MHVMVIGAHAFDAEALAGGMIARFVSGGHQGTLLHMTLGERGDPRKRPEDYAQQLKKESEAAARRLGCESYWMGYPAGQVPISEEVALALCRMIRKRNPDIVVTHWRGSWHPRHVATHYNVLRAVKLAADADVEGAHPPHSVGELYFGENCEDLDGFRASVYLDITEVLEIWFDAMACYELFRRSMPGHPDAPELGSEIPYYSFYRSMARVRGLESDLRYAQAFMSARYAVHESARDGLKNVGFEGRRLLLQNWPTGRSQPRVNHTLDS